jgi:WD40 repeat protein
MSRYALRLFTGTVLVRRVADHQEVARFQSRGDRDIFVFAFSPDGRYLTTTDYPGFALSVWDVDRNAIVATEPGPIGGGGAASFSPDSRRIAVGHSNGEVLIYDLVTGRPSQLQSGLGDVSHLAFRPDDVQIAVTSNVGKQPTCHLLEMESGRIVVTFAVGSANVVAWSPDGATLATYGGDLNIDLWDAPSGIRRARLEGSTNGGLHTAFHPAGKLLASNGWDSRLRLWDAALGRLVLSVNGENPIEPTFSRDGQIVVRSEDRLKTYTVEPALEYRALVHVSSEPIGYQRPSIHRDSRLLAVGSNTGVIFWDVVRGTECAFLPIGATWQVMFEASGDLLTSGRNGVRRWPVRPDSGQGSFKIGPPRELPFTRSSGQITEDRAGEIIAVHRDTHAEVLVRGRLAKVGPLDECRYVAVSPDGQWLATGSHHVGAQVWRVRDLEKVADIPVDTRTAVFFSPDGKYLLSSRPPCRLWTNGTWALARELGGAGLCFSPDSRLIALLDASKIICLVETETGRVIARLESPDSSDVIWATFSPDGSRLVLVAANNPAVYVWDLRPIRKRLAAIGLDWDAPAYPDDEQAASPLPPLQVDLGPSSSSITSPNHGRK